jgi:hypothetical protein
MTALARILRGTAFLLSALLLLSGCMLTSLAQGNNPPPASGGSDNSPVRHDIEQATSDRAQLTTIAFDALAWLTGDFCSDTFLPPGKVTDYFGFQFLRDNDPDEMGHNTSFVPRIANAVLAILTDDQIADLISLAEDQVESINGIAEMRYPMIDAFRRLLDNDLPSGTTGLDTDAVMAYGSTLFRLDGEVSLGRAIGLGAIARSLTTTQRSSIEDLASAGSLSWPDLPDQVDKTTMPHDVHVAVMTYASEFFSWYAGSIEADVYFCPERHGTYFGSFYMKDMPAMGNPDYSIPTELTGDSGEAFLNLLTTSQRTIIEDLVETQRDELTEIVEVREDISIELRKLMTQTTIDESLILSLSERYGELDAAIAVLYSEAFTAVYKTLSASQLAGMEQLRNLEGYACNGAYLFSENIPLPAIENTDGFFSR